MAFYGMYNLVQYGAPWKTGYNNVMNRLSLSHFYNHFLFYSEEILMQFSPIFIILILVAVLKTKNRYRFFLYWFAIFFIFYCFWKPGGDTWWWTRFLLPGIPPLFILAGIGAQEIKKEITRKEAPIKHLLTVFLHLGLILIVAYYIYFCFTHKDIMNKEKGKMYYDISESIAKKVPVNSYVGSIDFSGSILFYTRLETFNVDHQNAKRLIIHLLRKQKPIYFIIGPWNFQKNSVDIIWKNFESVPILKFEHFENLYLYKITKRKN
jgi:hypothetical protein